VSHEVQGSNPLAGPLGLPLGGFLGRLEGRLSSTGVGRGGVGPTLTPCTIFNGNNSNMRLN
jgi:hypothetical protein